MVKQKVENFWNEHKGTICLVGGACLVIAGSKYVKHIKKLNALNRMVKDGSVSILKKVQNAQFPDDMPIAQIKEALDKIEGAKYYDALVSVVEGQKTIYIR